MGEIWSSISRSFHAYIPNLLGALAILIIGWFFALIVSALVRGGLRRTGLGKKLAHALGGREVGKEPDVSRKVGKGVYYLIMILVLVAFFQALRLTLVTDPLNSLLNEVFLYLPRIVGAAILVIIAWIVATILKLIIVKTLGSVKLNERFGKKPDAEKAEETEGKSMPIAGIIADAVYWLVFLIFLPSILGALGLTGLLVPVQDMISEILGFLPNILIAVIILLIGWFVARLVRRIVANLLAAIGLDKLAEKIGMGKALGEQGLSGLVGLIVYIFILIPVLLAALNSLQLDSITQPTSNMLSIILEAIPSIFAATVIVIIAYLIGRLVSGLIASLLSGVGFDGLMTKIGLCKEVAEGKRTPSEIVGTLVLVAIMLFAVIEAAGLLGFTAIVDLTASFMGLAGHVVLGLIIFGVGLYLASLAAKAVRSTETPQAGFLAVVARVAILMLVGAIALRQMGLANEIINMAFGLLLGALAIAVAIAFGIGGREIAARKLDEWTKSMKSDKS